MKKLNRETRNFIIGLVSIASQCDMDYLILYSQCKVIFQAIQNKKPPRISDRTFLNSIIAIINNYISSYKKHPEYDEILEFLDILVERGFDRAIDEEIEEALN